MDNAKHRANESMENYLETILMLSKRLPVVRSVDIAEEMDFKKSSVSVAMKKLRENNPFSSNASPLPWDNMNPDLQDLNHETSDEIAQLIRQKRLNPAVPLGGLILGEAGSGKTHMLTRILRRLRSKAQFAVFVAVKAFTDPENAAQHVLSEVFSSMMLLHSNGHSQFDIITSEFMNAYRERRRNDGFDSIENLDMRVYVKKDIPTLDRNFLKCLLMYMSTSDEGVKMNILEWLRAGLDDEDSLKLGLPARNTDTMTTAKREQDAENILISLGLVLGYARVPMIICFDQLDITPDAKKDYRKIIASWGNIVSKLMNDTYGILPLCFMKAQSWNDLYLPILDQAVVQRVKNNSMTMKECSLKQAQQLIHDRITASFSEGADEIYNWLISRISLTKGMSPRDVIELANHVITSPDTPENELEEIKKVISNTFNDEYKKVQATQLAWPPNADHLTVALEVWLSSLEGFTATKTKGKYIRVKGVHGDKKFAFIIVIPRSHVTATNGVKEGLKFLKEYPGSFCCYVLEEKVHKPTWKKFAETLKEFERSGGFVARLTEDSRVNWYALTALINRIDNGDVNIYTSSRTRPATRSDILPFVSSLKLIDSDALKFPPIKLTHTPEQKPATPAPKPQTYHDEKHVADTLKSIISASPMKILAVDKAVELLSQRKVTLTRNEILAFVRNSSMFRTYSTKTDTLITIAEK